MDTVTLDSLEEGRKYQLKGWQMLKEENAELLIDGKRVESDYTFTADSEKMKVEISYTFDASELGGQNLVTFEELYDLKNPEEPVKVAEHKDIDDEGQTVLITERKISIHTTATDKNGRKEMEAGKDLTIVDTVTLEGLEIGTNYKLSGWQMVKAENVKLLIDGKEVTNDYEFTADKENMEVQIEFTFDGSTLGGKQLVTFEELYDMTNPEEPKKAQREINGRLFREGDKVMQIKNNYQLEWEVSTRFGLTVDKGIGVFNGDMGVIDEINEYTETVIVEYDEGRKVKYGYDMTDELELAYAITVHKSQGSEYPAVIIPLLPGPKLLYNRNLLYTAVTRAKKCLTIVGSELTFQEMIENKSEQGRFTSLDERIKEF